MCLVVNNTLYTANTGDSRAVYWKDRKAVRASVDHKPDVPAEEVRTRKEREREKTKKINFSFLFLPKKRRIRTRGGFVTNGRVLGKLAVSRALGDLELQKCGVTPEPYVSAFDLTEPPEFMILACDGVWDVLSDEAACNVVASELERDLTAAALKLRDVAYLLGSEDNISTILLKFK